MAPPRVAEQIVACRVLGAEVFMLKLIGISRQYGICQVLVIKYRYYFATQYFFTLFFHIVSLFQCERDVSKLLLRLFIYNLFYVSYKVH